MPAVTACLACRGLKAKCRREEVSETCVRCSRLGIACEIVPRKLGRRLGSRNRPKSGTFNTSSSRDGLITIHPYDGTHPRVALAPRDDDETSFNRQDTPSSNHAAMSWSNGLNVLARVADGMPPDHLPSTSGVVAGVRSGAGGGPSADGTGYSFDRRKFLELYRQASKTLDPDPYMGMAILEQGLDQLFEHDEKANILPEEEVVYSRIEQPRRDLLPAYDVITVETLSLSEVEDLLDVYWNRCHPIMRILDPSIYTLDYIRSTSAVLLTAILQVAAQCLPVSRHSTSLVARLDQHIDYVLAEIYKRGLQSLEICQGVLIYIYYARANKQHMTWQYMTQAISMAVELRLDVAATPAWLVSEAVYAHHSLDRKRRNVQRTWLSLYEWDRRLAFIRGRRPILRETALTTTSTLRAWYKEAGALECDAMSCAAANFRAISANIQHETQLALASHTPIQFEEHLANVDRQLGAWRTEWLPCCSIDDQRRAEHDLGTARFVLLMTPYDHRLSSGGMRGLARDECLIAALEVCKNAILLLGGAQPSMPIQNVTAGRLYLIGYTSLCALRIMNSTPRGDERPNTDVELFHLSILSALATRLCSLNVHPNMSTISSVLGRRLLFACRKVTTNILSSQSPEQPSEPEQPQMTTTAITTVLNPNSNVTLMDNDMGQQPIDLDILGVSAGTLGLGPQDLEFSWDFSHITDDLFPFFGDSLAPYPHLQ